MNAHSIAPGLFRLVRRCDVGGHRVAIIHFPEHRSFAGHHPATWTVILAPLPLCGKARNFTKYSRVAASRLFNQVVKLMEGAR